MGTIEVNAKVSTIDITDKKIIINLEAKKEVGITPAEYSAKVQEHMRIMNSVFQLKTSVNHPKPPIIGEMAIFWDDNSKIAYCAEYNGMADGLHHSHDGACTENAILFESADQFKEFIK